MLPTWLVSMFTSTAGAQSLLLPQLFPATGVEAYLVLDDGTRLEGTIGTVTQLGLLPKYKLKDAAGTKHKIDHARVVEAGIRPEGRPPVAAASLQEALRNERAELPPPEWLTFVRVPLDRDVVGLLMVLNPGFDRRMRVFEDPYSAGASGVGVAGLSLTGGGPTSYLVWRQGAPGPERVEKKGFDDRWDALFGDCPAAPRPDPVKWADFEEHLFAADRACGETGTAPR